MSYLASAPTPRQLDIITDTALRASDKTPPVCQPRGGPKNTPGLSTSGENENAPGLSTTTVQRIEARRIKLKISIRELCVEAGIRIETYDDARLLRNRTRLSTLARLDQAIDRLAAGRQRKPETLCMMALRLIVEKLAIASGWDPKLMLSQDFSSENTNDATWLQASRLRRCAIYLLVEEMTVVGKAEIAAAIGVSRQAVHKTVAAIEAERVRDNAFDNRLREAAEMLKGDLK